MVAKEKEKEEIIEGLRLYFIELPKFRQVIKKKEKYNKLEQWLIFIDGKEEEKVGAVAKTNKIIGRAKEEVEYLTGKEAKRRWAELREKWERDYDAEMKYNFELGEKRGERIGVKKNSIDIAKNMLKEKFDIEMIIKITQLSKNEIEKIAEKLL